MYIAHVVTEMSWRGGERQALELIKGLNTLGKRNILVCRQGSEIEKRALDSGVNVVHLPLRGEWDIFSAMKLRTFIKHESISLVHTHTAHAHSIAFLALIGIKSCKLIVSRRVDFHVRGYLSQKIKYGSGVDRIITVSDAIKRILIVDGIDPDRIVSVRSGFVTGQFNGTDKVRDIKAELKLPDDAVVAINVAALAAHKDQNTLLKSAAIVAKKHPSIRFLIAGDGELREALEKNINSLGLSEFVILLGFVKDIASVYKAADLFVMSSAEEGLGTSILDAMYFNLPIVATRAGGIPEIVRDGVNGLVVPVGDHIQLAEKICYLIEHPDRREMMASRSAEILKDNTIESTIQGTLGVYHEVLDM